MECAVADEAPLVGALQVDDLFAVVILLVFLWDGGGAGWHLRFLRLVGYGWRLFDFTVALE